MVGLLAILSYFFMFNPHTVPWQVQICIVILLFSSSQSVCRDTPGQERYKAITTASYKGILVHCDSLKCSTWLPQNFPRFRYSFCFAQGIVLVYDVTFQLSFDNIQKWLHEIEQVSSKTFLSYILFSFGPRTPHYYATITQHFTHLYATCLANTALSRCTIWMRKL